MQLIMHAFHQETADAIDIDPRMIRLPGAYALALPPWGVNMRLTGTICGISTARLNAVFDFGLLHRSRTGKRG
jgi:hypothetical protein